LAIQLEVIDTLAEYDCAKSSLGLMRGLFKRFSMKREFNKKTFLKDIEGFYKIALYLYKLHKIGQTYYEKGNEQQKYYGEVLMEAVAIYLEKLDQMAVNMEIMISVGDFKTEGIESTIIALQNLFDDQKLKQAIEAASDMQVSIEAVTDLHQSDQKAFDKKLHIAQLKAKSGS